MSISDLRVSNIPEQSSPILHKPSEPSSERLWQKLYLAAEERFKKNSLSAHLLQAVVLNSDNLEQGLSRILSYQLHVTELLEERLLALYKTHPDLILAVTRDLDAVVARDPAVTEPLTPFLYFKGFHALQTYRLAHALWLDEEFDDALFLQSQSSLLYGVDIHPASKIGSGIMFDHATGLVIGETAVVEDHVSILHGVTLGGTGKEQGDRHPKIRTGVMIGAGATVLGNVEVGAGACIAAGSVVLQNVPSRTRVAGVPAKIVGVPRSEKPADEMDQSIE